MTNEEMQTTITDLSRKLQDFYYDRWYNRNTMFSWNETDEFKKYHELEDLIYKMEELRDNTSEGKLA